MSGIPNPDQYSKQFQTVVTFEPGTVSLGGYDENTVGGR